MGSVVAGICGSTNAVWTRGERMNTDERIDAIAMHLELASSVLHQATDDINLLSKSLKVAHDSILALARVAEAHEHRLTHLEEGRA